MHIKKKLILLVSDYLIIVAY